MSQRTKQRKQNGCTLFLYGRVLHPELFNILRADSGGRKSYDADIWLVEGGHVIRFTAGDNTLTEVFINDAPQMPERGLMQSLLCRGERYHEADTHENIRYMISTQEEQLTGSLFEATRQEIKDYAAKRELMMAETPATENKGGYLGVLDVERRANEILVQSFHLFDETQMVVKTQGIVELIRKPAKA